MSSCFGVRDMSQTVAVGLTKADTPKQAAAVLQRRKRLDKNKYRFMVYPVAWKAIGVWFPKVREYRMVKMLKRTNYSPR